MSNVKKKSAGPYDLSVTATRGRGDTADLRVQWKSGACPFPDSTLYTQVNGGKEFKETETSDTYYTIHEKEFWTNYTVTLKPSFLCGGFEYVLTSTGSTGPGSEYLAMCLR